MTNIHALNRTETSYSAELRLKPFHNAPYIFNCPIFLSDQDRTCQLKNNFFCNLAGMTSRTRKQRQRVVSNDEECRKAERGKVGGDRGVDGDPERGPYVADFDSDQKEMLVG